MGGLAAMLVQFGRFYAANLPRAGTNGPFPYRSQSEPFPVKLNDED